MTIIELIQGDNFFTRRVASTRGGEYAGPCPWCGGKDRFRCWPAQGEYGKYWCRECGHGGDAIQYLRDFRGLSFKEACDYLGKDPGPAPARDLPAAEHTWRPRQISAPGELWQARARQLVAEAVFNLPVKSPATVSFLTKSKGLSKETIKKFSLGWIPADRWEATCTWGLPEMLKENGKAKKLWFPKGLTIPLFQGNKVVRLRIRRPEGDPRYFLLKGSSTAAMMLHQERRAVVVVESELDAMLLWQEVGELVDVLCLGNVSTRPDQEAADLLDKRELILLALDADKAGAAESWGWWKAHYDQAQRWPPIRGKDPSDMLLAGVNIKNWIKAALEEYGCQS
jgi:DNA primase